MRSLLLASLLASAAACSSAYADQVAIPQPAGPRTALAIAPEKARAPYDVQIITEDGDTAPTYALRGRYYVQGNLNERYIIRVTNPTPSRVEAVVSVDGLDVVDGEAGDLGKRGYIVPAYGEVRIEGFRTSLADVATFRFSSVDGSYAGRKGKARNVGVIAVAIFEEQAPPPDVQIIQPDVTVRPRPRPYYRYDDAEASRGGGAARDKKAATATAPSAGEAAGDMGAAEGRVGGAQPAAPRMRPPVDEDFEEAPPPPVTTQTTPRPTNRPGLGTEFGEQRYSAASYTKFVRAPGRPIAIAELRYNDAQGLMALGIPVAPMPDEGEIMMRETADPFPGDRFAKPPVR
jgi:hypothetical protein